MDDSLRRLVRLPVGLALELLVSGHVDPPIPQMNLRPTLPAEIDPRGELDLLTFLQSQAAAATRPLDVTVTGHSKGGALAPTVALWLADALRSGAAGEAWDVKGNAHVSCHAFAGPTPGNAAFAQRLDAMLGAAHHHLRNTNDIVTHAWQDDELRQIPSLYDKRSAPFEPLLNRIANGVQQFQYRQALTGVRKFKGALDSNRLFGAEFVHQHMEAYLEELELTAEGIHAFTFFV